MKCTIVIDPKREEEIVIYAQRETALTEAVQALCQHDLSEIIGYRDKEATRLSSDEIVFFTVENGRVFAVCQDTRWLIKRRLYELEQILPPHYLKINQSCLANVHHIRRFDASIAGSLQVCFDNGARDYVSRRNVKSIKERLKLSL